MTRYNQQILEAAGQYLALAEWPGAKQNPDIVEMFAEVGHSWVKDDETPWCAAFVGSVLASLGLPHTGKLNARSYMSYGAPVKLEEARPGDIIVFWRGTKSSAQGHVAFLVEIDGNRVKVRGGNQGNKVSDAYYPMDRIIAIRRADNVQTDGKRPVLREGDQGVWVLDLQVQLKQLNYFVGELDDQFGSRVRGALVRFQSDNGLEPDGVAGPRTWKTLETAKPAPARNVSETKLREESRTIQTADSGKRAAAAMGTLAIGGSAVSAIEEAVAVGQRAGGIVEQLKSAGPSLLVILVVIIGGVWIYQRFNRVTELRIEDARTGANDKI